MALLPPSWLDAVVAIGVGDIPDQRRWIGTGFFFGDRLQTDSPQCQPYIVTNKHVVRNQKKIWIKINSATGIDSSDYPVELELPNGRKAWTGHSDQNVDVAVIQVHGGFLHEQARKYAFFQSDVHSMRTSELVESQITEGDRVFVLGFPLGIVDSVRQYALCRHGILARVRDFVEGRSKTFLIDASVYPGNSGGPVILCPSALSIEGTKPVSKAALIGVVKEYLFYEDVAVSRQTGAPRISFQENSGLAVVESVDSICEAIEEDKKSKQQIQKQ
jgi:hypothetical protein